MKATTTITLREKTKTGMLSIPAFAVFMGLLFSTPATADITNDATASGTYNSQVYQSEVSTASVPVTPALTGLIVTKDADPDTNVPVGTVVTYTYTVKNNGTVTVTDINLNDVHNASGPAPIPDDEAITDVAPFNDSTDAELSNGIWSSLAPGDTVTFTATYTVTQTDINNRQ